jgi:hypothetical protein
MRIFPRSPATAGATAFFIEDLYGAKDFSSRDQAMLRILPVMTRMLPQSAVETAAPGDRARVAFGGARSRARRRAGARTRHRGDLCRGLSGERQSRRSRAPGRDSSTRPAGVLDTLVGRPLVERMLKLMRRPARMAGLADLQDFLERGFAAFRAMQGADEFLAVVKERETRILNRLFFRGGEAFFFVAGFSQPLAGEERVELVVDGLLDRALHRLQA